jgi:hypothetical protein
MLLHRRFDNLRWQPFTCTLTHEIPPFSDWLADQYLRFGGISLQKTKAAPLLLRGAATVYWVANLGCLGCAISCESPTGAFEAEEGAAINPKAFPLKLA